MNRPLSQSAIDQLEAIDGVIVQDQDQEWDAFSEYTRLSVGIHD